MMPFCMNKLNYCSKSTFTITASPLVPLLIMEITFPHHCSCLSKNDQKINMPFLLLSLPPKLGFLIWLLSYLKTLLFCFPSFFVFICLVNWGVHLYYAKYTRSASNKLCHMNIFYLPLEIQRSWLTGWRPPTAGLLMWPVSSEHRLSVAATWEMLCTNLIYLPPQ